MKNIFYAVLIWLLPCTLTAQRYNPEAFDLQHKKYTAEAGMLSLMAEKSLLELREVTMITVRVNWVNSEEDMTVPQQYDYRFQDPSKAPWKITEWKILEGTGELRPGSENYYATFTAPDKMPAGKHATILVTLMPQDPTKPKVQLLQTIYLADNDNVFYFDCKYLGINQEKYVIKGNGGALASSDASAKKVNQENRQEAMKQAAAYYQKAIEAGIKTEAHGFDLDALTSNTRAVYAKDENVTTITISDDKVAMVAGKESNTKRIFNIVLSIPGRSTGTFKIRSDKKITASVLLPRSLMGIACACAEDPTDPNHIPPTCTGGTITITKYDGKIVEGYISAGLEAQDYTKDPPPTFYSTINGKFKVLVANR